MGRKLLFKIKEQNFSKYKIPTERVKVANAEIEEVDEIYSIPCHVGNKGTLHQVRYLPNLCTALVIGLDFIRNMDAIIDTNGTWHYKSNPQQIYKFYSEKEEVRVCNGITRLTGQEKEILDELVMEAKSLEPTGYPPTKLMEHEIQLKHYRYIRIFSTKENEPHNGKDIRRTHWWHVS